MATKEKDTNKELEVEEIVSRSEQFIENNSKKIIYGIIALRRRKRPQQLCSKANNILQKTLSTWH